MLTTALLAVAATGGFGQGGGASFGDFRNKPLPDFIMTSLDGKKITRSQLKGKVVLFDFWATWCGPCKAASPAIQKLYSKYSSKGVLVIGADTFEHVAGPAGAKQYKAEHHYNYLFTYENDGLAQSLGIQGIPAFALVDRHGIVRDAISGIPRTDPVNGLYAHFSKEIDGLLKS